MHKLYGHLKDEVESKVMLLLKEKIKKNWTTSRGFTLVELMIVIAIMGIMAAVGTTALHYYTPRYRLNSASLDIISTFYRARVSAIRDNDGTSQCVLVFEPDGAAGALPGGSYYVFEDTNANWIEDAGETKVVPRKGMPHGVVLFNVNFNNNGNLQPSATRCCAYNMQGIATRAVGGGTFVTGSVSLQAGQMSRVVRANFTVTGRVSLQRRDASGGWVDQI